MTHNSLGLVDCPFAGIGDSFKLGNLVINITLRFHESLADY